MRGDDFGYLYRHNWSLVFRPYKFPEVRGSVCSEQGALLEGWISGSPRLKQKKRSWGLSLVTVLISVRIDESADGRTLFQSVSGRFVECSRH